MANGASPSIANVDLFTQLDDKTLRSLVALAEDATYEADAHIFDQAVRPAEGYPILHVITEGQATVQINGVDRAVLSDGDYFGEIMLFDEVVPSATIIAGSGGLKAQVLKRSQGFADLQGDPAFSNGVVLALCARLRDLEFYDVTWAFKDIRFPVR